MVGAEHAQMKPEKFPVFRYRSVNVTAFAPPVGEHSSGGEASRM